MSKVPDQTTYTYNQTVVLTMGTVDAGWTFTGWSGAGATGIDPCTVTITGNTTVTANFTQDEYSLDRWHRPDRQWQHRHLVIQARIIMVTR